MQAGETGKLRPLITFSVQKNETFRLDSFNNCYINGSRRGRFPLGARDVQPSMSLNFEKPPINEVVIGIYFKPVIQMRAESLGVFWEKIRNDLPSTSQVAPLTPQTPVIGEVFPLPRFWFQSKDETRLLQLQRDLLFYNWRERADVYPRFNTLKNEFDRYYSLFNEFLSSLGVGQPEVSLLDLTYVNVIGKDEQVFRIDDYPKVVPTFRPPIRVPSGQLAQEYNHTNFFNVADDLQLVVVERTATKIENQEMVFLLELRVNSIRPAEIDPWLRKAHDLIVNTFEAMTSKEAQELIWKKR